MSYSKVAVKLPADSLSPNTLGGKSDEVQLNFLPMGSAGRKKASPFSMGKIQEMEISAGQCLEEYF